MFTSVVANLSFNNHRYVIKIPQLIGAKGKWMILGPEIQWQEHFMRYDIFIEEEQEQIKELNKIKN